MSYEILSDLDISIPHKNVKARRIVLLIDVTEPQEAQQILTQAARDLTADNDELLIFAYLEKAAMAWQGWIARAIAGQNQGLKIYFDNDPLLREALYREFQE